MPIHADGAIPNTIMVGDLSAPLYTFTNDDLSVSTLKGQFSQSMISNELPIDTMSLTVGYKQNTSAVIYRPIDDGYNKTLQSSGWIARIRQPDEIDIHGNSVAFPILLGDRYTGTSFDLFPPNHEYAIGDTLKIKIKINELSPIDLSSPDCYLSINVGRGTPTSETGLFQLVQSDNKWHCIASSVGEDTLTFQFYGLASMTFHGDASVYLNTTHNYVDFEITYIEYNGQVVYGAREINSYFAGYIDTDNNVYATSQVRRLTEKNFLRDINSGTPVWWFCGPAMIAKFFVQSVDRISTNLWTIKCISAIGLLEDQVHVGGIYTGQSFESVFNEIVGNTFSHDYLNDDDNIANLQVFGWLPYDTARNNLHRLLFAYGAILQRNWVFISDDEVT